MAEETYRNNFNQEDQSDFNFSDIWGMIWGYRWWYVLSLCICIVFAAFYLYKTPSTYSRSAKVIINEDAQDATLRDIANISGFAGQSSSVNVNNEVEAFASPDLMKTVVERLGLETSYVEHQFMRDREFYNNSPVELSIVDPLVMSSFSFRVKKGQDSTFTLSDFTIGPDKLKKTEASGAIGDTLSTPVGTIVLLPTIYASDWDDDITVSWVNSRAKAKAFANNLSATVSGKQTSVVVLALEDTYASRAENILNTLIDVYNDEWVHDKNRSARNTTDFINERLVVIEQELGGIETDLKEYKEQNKLTDMQALSASYLEESSEYATKSFEVNNQLSIAQYIRDYLTEPANANALIPANSGLTNTDIESQISEYNQIVLQRDKLIANSSNKNPLIADMNAAMAAIRSTIIRSIDNLLATLNLQAEKIKSQEDQIMARIASSSGQQMELLSIERQQKVKESLYIYLLQKREENEIASLVNVGNTRLIMSPTGSPAPVSPNKMMIMLVALVLGAGIPFGVIFLGRMMDNTVSNKKDLSILSIPFLSEIPQMKSSMKRNIANIGRHKFDNQNCRIVVKKGSRNVINEAFRVLRTNLDMMLGKGNGCEAIMVTSFNPNAGKTFITMNIAASMALKGQKVLMIDLDLRKATLSKSIDKNHEGVVSYLIGKHDNLERLIQNVDENLDILSVGTLPPNPTELLLSERFGKMLSTLKSRYRYIFLDCPPVDIVADTAIIAQSADVSVFPPCRRGTLPRQEVQQDGRRAQRRVQALRRIRQIRVRTLRIRVWVWQLWLIRIRERQGRRIKYHTNAEGQYYTFRENGACYRCCRIYRSKPCKETFY